MQHWTTPIRGFQLPGDHKCAVLVQVMRFDRHSIAVTEYCRILKDTQDLTEVHTRYPDFPSFQFTDHETIKRSADDRYIYIAQLVEIV